MLKPEIEKRLTTFIVWGSLCVTLLITDRVSSDPVNVGKMVSLALSAGTILPLIIISRKKFSVSQIVLFGSLLLFLLFSLVSILLSKNSIELGLYGAYGRNTGLITYISFVLIFIGSSLLSNVSNYARLIRAFLICGILNLVYCIVAAQGKDIFTWINPYKKVLGTFGNPNFISSFMGIFIAGLISILLSQRKTTFQTFTLVLLIMLSTYVIFQTGSQQGIVVAVGGSLVALFFYFRSKFKSNLILISYLTSISFFSLIAILGMLQIGPLTRLLYKPSVSLRGEYWKTGINMASENPIFGVGLDSYGTYFRKYRDFSATVFPGMDTVSNAAHNVFIDIFAGVGIFGLIAYLVSLLIVLSLSYKFSRTFREYDTIFVFLFSTWISFLAQSIISINQIGLAIWGWVFGGALFGYTLSKLRGSNSNIEHFSLGKLINPKHANQFSPVPAGLVLSSFATGILMFSISIPSFIADAKLRSGINKGSQDLIYQAGKSWPQDPNRVNFAASRISQGGINQQALELVKLGISKFPDDYGLLTSEFLITAPDSTLHLETGRKLHKADPFNPKYFEFK